MSARGTNAVRAASVRGRSTDAGDDSPLRIVDIGHHSHDVLMDAEVAFWSLIARNRLDDVLADGPLIAAWRAKRAAFAEEMDVLRFRLTPSAVYFNPTERCNLDCTYCYIPADMRRRGQHMGETEMTAALDRLRDYFRTTVPEGRKPQIIFHGAEPLLNREVMFAAIDRYHDDFRFGVQTNATLLDDDAAAFLMERGVGIGLSLDGPVAEIADRTRRSWGGEGTYAAVIAAMERLRGYDGYNVIATINQGNVAELTRLVELFHAHEVPACMLNVVRCTQPAAETVRADDALVTRHYLAALERSHALYRATGRKLVVVNFANILISILAPTARRLMCDISPCGGGRSFFALAPNGDLFPCSEFIGLPAFKGGNLFQDRIEDVLASPAFRTVTGRRVEDIAACHDCTMRHFCGAPCPAEAHEMNGGMDQTGAYCGFYAEQASYAFRLIADGRHDDFLWDGWDDGTEVAFSLDLARLSRSTPGVGGEGSSWITG
ncbi:MAG: peptide-modifying radical SAM enzyme CbpB [Alphaproteobacteria bacterium]